MSFEKPKSSADWYREAREKIREFISGLDPDLSVEVATGRIVPKTGNEYDGFLLVFAHRTKPELHWIMLIDENDNYIQNELEDVVKRKYLEIASSPSGSIH